MNLIVTLSADSSKAIKSSVAIVATIIGELIASSDKAKVAVSYFKELKEQLPDNNSYPLKFLAELQAASQEMLSASSPQVLKAMNPRINQLRLECSNINRVLSTAVNTPEISKPALLAEGLADIFKSSASKHTSISAPSTYRQRSNLGSHRVEQGTFRKAEIRPRPPSGSQGR